MKFSKKTKIRIAILLVIVLLPIALYQFLLSSFAMTTFWLPMVKKYTGIEVNAAQCSVSLFSSPTLYVKKLTAVKSGELNAALDELSLTANPLEYLTSGQLIVSELKISKLKLDYRQTKTADTKTPKTETTDSKTTKKTDSPLIVIVKKLNLSDSSVTFTDADKNKYELAGLSFSCTDFMPAGKPAIKFKSLFSMNSEKLNIAPTPLSADAELELDSKSVIPNRVNLVFTSGTILFSGKDFKPIEASAALRLNAGVNGDKITVSSSSFHLRDAKGHDVVRTALDGNFNQKTLSGKLEASLNTSRSELQDALITAFTGEKVKNVSLRSNLSAEFSDSQKQLSLKGDASLNADKLYGKIRNVTSDFAFVIEKPKNENEKHIPFVIEKPKNENEKRISIRAEKSKSENEKRISIRKIHFNLKESSGLFNFNLESSKDFSMETYIDKPFVTIGATGFLTLQTGKLNLPQLASSFGISDKVPMKSGILTSDLKLEFTSAKEKFAKLNGMFSLTDFVSTLGDAPVEPANFHAALLLHLNTDLPEVVLEFCKITGSAGKKKFLDANLKGAIEDLNARLPIQAEAQISTLNEAVFEILPFQAVKKLKVEKFNTELNSKWRLDKNKAQTVSVSGTIGNLMISGAQAPLALSLGGNLALDNDKVKINALALTSSERNLDFFDLNLKGIYYFNAENAAGRNELLLSSKFIDAKKIQDILLLFKEQKAVATPAPAAPEVPKQPPTEPAPMNLAKYNGVVNFAFEKIQYTNDAVLSVNGPIEITGNQIFVNDLKIMANNAPVGIKFMIDAGLANGYVYNGAFAMKNLLLPPFLKAAMNGNDQGVTGTITSVDMVFKGKGVTLPNIKRNLNGKLTASTANLSFPALSAQTVDALNVLFIPLSAIPSLTGALDIKYLSGDLQNLSNNVSGILKGTQNVEFTKGTIDVTASNGVVTLNRFQFEGGTLKSESVTGKINLLTEQLNLNAVLNLGILVIPMNISGTLSSPAPDFKNFLRQFAKDNIENALKPENIENTIRNVDSIIDLFKKRK